jgi:hypothetical protein
MISLHDHRIRGFSVDVANKRLQVSTELRTESDPRHAVGVFDGVEAYVLHGDVLGTIIFRVPRRNLGTIVSVRMDWHIQRRSLTGGRSRRPMLQTLTCFSARETL